MAKKTSRSFTPLRPFTPFRLKLFLPLALLAFVFAVVSPAATVPPQGIYGKVTIGPSCPVQSTSPGLTCAAKVLVHVRIDARRFGHRHIVGTVWTTKLGRYRFHVAPGVYSLTVDIGPQRPTWQQIPVRSRAYTHLNLMVDSGIR
jgi:hypothetical protein